MTIPNGSGLPGGPSDPARPQPPYNPKPSTWSSVPRTVLAGGAAAVVAAVVILVVTLSGGGDNGDNNAGGAPAAGTSASATTPAPKFVPDLFNAEFGDGWRDKTTNEMVTPPQRIKITGSLDLTERAESIGYGANERSLPKNGNYATTDSSFPIKGRSVNMFTDTDNVLHLSWNCEFVAYDPNGENCREIYHIAFDVSGSEPAILSASNTVKGLPGELGKSKDTTSSRVVVTNPSELPASVLGVDSGTGAETVLLLAAAQPRESSTKVYFVVGDSLTLYSGELESSR